MAQNAKFHAEPFDEGTLCKLEVYRQYLRNWLPKFKTSPATTIVLLDYFCGPGGDPDGKPGSPLIALEEVERSLVESYQRQAEHSPVEIRFYDCEESKIEALRERLAGRATRSNVRVTSARRDFEAALQETNELLESGDCACLAFIDQFGIKEVTKERFLMLVNSPRTDVLFFLASASVKRFIGTSEFQRHVRLTPASLANVDKTDVHRFLCEEYYKPMIPEGVEYFLAPFSILKGDNVYGLVFGSSSLRGLETFLDVAWKMDEVSGSANFNIDGELVFEEGEFEFAGSGSTTKLQSFEAALIDEIRKGGATNKSIYRFTLERGFCPKHATPILSRLRKGGVLKVLDLTVTPERVINKDWFYLGWKQIHKEKRLVEFRLEEDALGLQQD